ncbi:NAD-dependent succinate-semialdehyde dehydrogenase [Candidatus Dojkabacteria bacterium]|uniref:NAD-dependent succinate-semialdehyde dehydrogenase n=1 Tax=Candidatus Dojkabacteria bacterium TaxID=2099670 RepID=A0A955L6T3_9BACT|nr:NAD-dependent succinate-semialdehyde dehydrogenase [Candidatus Dojkabacteria bacterium]
MPIQAINPATGEMLQSYNELTDKELEQKLQLAHSTFLKWKETSFAERKEKMLKVAELLKARSSEYGELMTTEMGKPFTQAKAEAEKCAWNAEYFAENSEEFLAEEIIKTDASESYVRFDPLGIILLVMPWNYAFWQVIRQAVPSIMAGNTIVLKHASNVPGSALAIEKLFRDAGFPEGVFQTLLIGSSKVQQVLEDFNVKGVSLTGSDYAGSKVGEVAGRNLKKMVLELGGNDPFIILEDGEVEIACEVATTARLQNNGQSCIAAKRFIVVESKYDEFLEKYVAFYKKQVIGDPMDPKTTIGPLVSEKSLEEILDQIDRTVKAGAKVAIGGKRYGDKGSFLEPTILVDVEPGMPSFVEEVFGPVASVIKAKDEAEAIAYANDTVFGLGASLWTNDLERAKRIIPQINAGCVFVNGMVKSDPRLPFGGINRGGLGREMSQYGIKEFVNIKTVWIK